MSDIAARTRSERQVWAAPGSSHDRLVRLSSIVLPVAIGVLAAFLVMAPLTMRGDVSFLLDKNKVEVAKERLLIQKALYRGEDGKGQPFALTAGNATQKSSSEPIVKLSELSAAIRLPDGPASLIANQGRYNMTTEQVMMDGPVLFRAANGYRLDTQNSIVDLKTRKLQSGGAVTGTVPQGRFSANAMKADLETHIVTLDGNARLRIVPGRAK
ncbi:LPS export ABC transporter periplasmic protein LptC [Sphingomonas sp. Leaf357]|uniref:LPS export ABC transporter periplasmic protein LptC n=1 Tax=Sphingomonas sp. Leaf357 TaxID=1736350 RepID=UPI0006FAD9B4|nr:LPS export ABC transporter periplasmic protein LptC [Sphingomonas sp. Leaf357]KQS03292.1 LPS export ABC transporter periplasmic protein LptC [Sphingomonas sp. Leaf357]